MCLLVLLCVGCASEEPDFAIHAPADTVTLVLGQVIAVDVEVERMGGLSDAIIVSASGLRAGITAGTVRFPVGQNMGVLELNVETSVSDGPIDGALLVGIAGDMERTTPISLVVMPPPAGAP